MLLNIGLALLGYPLSIVANLTTDQLKAAMQRTDFEPLKGIFLKAFFKSLDLHLKNADEYAKGVIKVVRKEVKKDNEMLWRILSPAGTDAYSFLVLVKGLEFKTRLAERLVEEFSLNANRSYDLVIGIVSDCLSNYLAAFFSHMTEKEGIQTLVLASLQFNSALDLLKSIDSRMVTKADFDNIRAPILSYHLQKNSDAQRDLTDYRNYLKKKFRYIEIKGFSPRVSGKEIQMEIEDLFVPMEISMESAGKISIEAAGGVPSRNFKVAGPIDADIDYWSSGSSSDKDEARKKGSTILDALKLYRNIVILGDPGSGKSSLLKYLAYTIAKTNERKQPLSHLVPIYLRVADYASYFGHKWEPLYQFIIENFDKQHAHIFKEALECGNSLLLIDGLDEVTNKSLRIRIVEQVMDFMARYPLNCYVITSRIVGYNESRLGGECKHFKLAAFSPDKIKHFTQNWYKSIAKNTDKNYDHAEEQAENLYSNISRNRSVVRLATNPLLMTIIALIHYRGRKLPNRRIELYDISTETFLEYWVQLRTDDESKLKDKNEVIEIMAAIAFSIHESQPQGLIPEDALREAFMRQFQAIHSSSDQREVTREFKEFLNFLGGDAGYFYEKGEDSDGKKLYGFIHQTFQEYLAAIEFGSRWKESQLKLATYVFDPRWTEIIRLAAAQIRLSSKGRSGRNEVSRFVGEILRVEDKFPEAYRPLQLVLLIMADDVNISDDLASEVVESVVKALLATDSSCLRDSFIKVIGEVLSSECCKILVDQLREEFFSSGEDHARSRIAYILLALSVDSEIRKILEDALMRGGSARRAIFEVPWRRFPFQKTEEYKSSFMDCLNEEQVELNSKRVERLARILHEINGCNYLEAGTLDNLSGNINAIILTLLNLGHKETSEIFVDECMRNFLTEYIFSFEPGANINRLAHGLQDNLIIKNFLQILAKLDDILTEAVERRSGKSALTFGLTNHFCILLRIHRGDRLMLIACRADFTDLIIKVADPNTYDQLLEDLGDKISDRENKSMRANINYILGPIAENADKNAAIFISGYQSGLLYDFFGWEEGFLLFNMHINPSILSRIAVENAEHYLASSLWEDRIGSYNPDKILLDEYEKAEVILPARLLALYLSKKPISENLIHGCLTYFRNCTIDKERKGTFEILYHVLNPFQLV